MNGSIPIRVIQRVARVASGGVAVVGGAVLWAFGVAITTGAGLHAKDDPPASADPAAASVVAPVEAVDAKTWRKASATIDETTIRGLVNTLASDEMNGRYYLSEDGWRAARYIAEQFEAAGWRGAGDDEGGYFQFVDGAKRSERAADAGEDEATRRVDRDAKENEAPRPSPNVVAVRRGTGNAHLLLTAHYDHLEPAKIGDDRIFNGADDNAAGVAALIALARAVTAMDVSLETTIVLVAFTGEEYGLVGSKYYVEHPRFPLENAVCIVNADMISRGEPKLLYVEGGRQFPRLARAAQNANRRPGVELDLHFDEHPRWLYMSDQRPFVFRGVPALYLGVDFHPDTHRVTDEASRILPDLVVRTTRLMLAIAIDLDGVEPSVTRPPRSRSDKDGGGR